ncbi:hypothetical protein [Pleionea sediminis]|uniref:hypothetical protein n=1 Tax=Pleionea sediminis TaxID=2569479 RepID=UPI001185779D|nr:hypothetical protein [Pleionea sediminis]
MTINAPSLTAYTEAQIANKNSPDKELSATHNNKLVTGVAQTQSGNLVRPAKPEELAKARKEQIELFKEALKTEYSNVEDKFFDELLKDESVLTPRVIHESIEKSEQKIAQLHKESIKEKEHVLEKSDSLSTINTQDAAVHLRAPNFKTQSQITDKDIEEFLSSEDGIKFMDMLNYIDIDGEHDFQGVARSKEFRKEIAFELIKSGNELPKPVSFNKGDILVKISTSEDLSQHSLYFTTKSELEKVIKDVNDGKCSSIASAFGLPVGSVDGSDSYVMHMVEVKEDCTGWTSTVAPTKEVHGKLKTTGGATQVFVGRNKLNEVSQDKPLVTREGISVASNNDVVTGESPGMLGRILSMLNWN